MYSAIILTDCYDFYRLEENAKLQWPYRQLRCRVECSYEPLEPSQIPLVQGCQVIVFKKEGAYWKGRFRNQVHTYIHMPPPPKKKQHKEKLIHMTL